MNHLFNLYFQLKQVNLYKSDMGFFYYLFTVDIIRHFSTYPCDLIFSTYFYMWKGGFYEELYH